MFCTKQPLDKNSWFSNVGEISIPLWFCIWLCFERVNESDERLVRKLWIMLCCVEKIFVLNRIFASDRLIVELVRLA